jgi:hypothetical protein
MTEPMELDLSELRRGWAERRARTLEAIRRIDPRGMTRPARAPEERAFLEARGGTPFIDDERIGELARAYYRKKYGG